MVKDRIVLLDSLRGLAVLGILLCNIPISAQPHSVATSLTLWPLGMAPASVAVWWITQVFFQQKFYSMFAMLFGASILMVGGEGGDAERRRILILRLVSLLAIGLFHGFVIWQGDVLNTYAVVGLLAMWARSWSPKRLLQAGVAVHLSLSVWSAWKLLKHAAEGGGDPSSAEMAKFLAGVQADSAQYAGTFQQSFVQNAKDFWDFTFDSFVSWPQTWPILVLSLILIGMGLYKLGVLSGKAPTGVYQGLIGAGLGALAIVGLAETIYMLLPSHPWAPRALARWLQSATAPVVNLGYVGLMVLAMRSRLWKAIPAVLAPVGQMAFTNYLTQSILMTTLLYGGRGPGLYGKVDRPFLAGAVATIWLIQILWSRWWMARFTMGPLEWLWRLAYRGPMPLRRAPEAAPVAA
ncbi:DUF418 domain-containing protein [Caulobacter soli]|uniref:DUF418 domain-containing protein n=1 Tax=Caulobacter soli TaxID=2708539 RepID=UPI0013EC510E|nr:DUF418 domain-containing protein [Caulobacter soli]